MFELTDVTVVYPDKTKAVDGVSFSLRPGESAALLGANGAGKTSLLLAGVGILELAGGGVTANGVPLSKKTLNEFRREVGLVFQNPDDQLFMPLIRDDIAFGCRSYGLSEEETEERVNAALRDLRIEKLRDRSPLRLSGGEKRMAAIATVLAMNPSVLLFDEPTAFLDPGARHSLKLALGGLSHTKVIATHDMAFARETCGRVIVLAGGKVAADGPVSLLEDEGVMRRCGLWFRDEV